MRIAIGKSLLPWLPAVVGGTMLLALGAAAPAQGQTIRDILDQARRSGVPPSAILDEARRRAALEDAARVSGEGQRIPTEPPFEPLAPPEAAEPTRAEKDALERFCRGEDDAVGQLAANVSALELDYCRRLGEPISQFGYAAFERTILPQSVTTGAIPGDYVLGIGDELIITFHGQETGTQTVSVDSEGRVVLQKLPPILAAGRSFEEFRRELEARTRSSFLGTDVFVSIGSVRLVTVAVLGEVRRPGLHRLSGLSSILDAFALAGGIKKTGSLRRLQVQRGDRLLWIDLYELLVSGALANDLTLFDGDRIFVPPLGSTVAAAGGVKRPGIFELGEGEESISIAELIGFSGGTLRPRGQVYYHVGFDADGREQITERRDTRGEVVDGDIVVVQRREDIQVGGAELAGHVRVAGRRSLSFARSVGTLVGGYDSLKPDPYLAFAALETTDPQTRSRRLLPINLERILSRQEDYALNDGDRLFVFGSEEIRYLSSSEVQDVLLGRPIRGLAAAPGAQSPTVREQVETVVAEGGEVQRAPAIPAVPSGVPICAGLRQLAAIISRGQSDRFAHAILARGSEAAVEFRERPSCPPIFSEHADLLPFMLEYGIALYGEVRRPGIYPVTGDTSLSSVITASGGMTVQADPSDVLVSTEGPDGSGGSLQTTLDLRRAAPEATVGPGDIVRLGATPSATLIGDVRVPGRRPLSSAPTVHHLVGSTENLRTGAYLPFAILESADPETRARRLFALDLARILAGKENYALRDRDRLFVLGAEDIAYLSSKDIQDVILLREVPGLSITRETGEALQEQAVATEAGAVGEAEERAAILRAARADSDRLPTACPGLQALASVVSGTTTARYASALRAGLAQEAVEFNLRRVCPPLFVEEPALLPFALEHVVAVNGEVREPGAYPITAATPISSIVAVSGGLSREADKVSVELSRLPLEEGQTTLQRSMVDLGSEAGPRATVNPGDIVRFNPLFTDRDRGPVLLAGEVLRPGFYDIRRGEKLSSVIQRAGGLTEQAYPYGTIFTRERVKQAEADGLKRAARDVQSALTVVASRRNTDPEQIAVLQRLAVLIASTEAVGRVVLEADPSVLAVRPELDTVLEPGDRLFVPKRPGYVSVSGDVLNPGTLQFVSGKTAEDYLRQAGGLQYSADDDRVFVIFPNGEAQRVSTGLWNIGSVGIPPGSTIVVPRDPSPFDFLGLVAEITPVISQLALTAASLAVVSRN